MPFAASSATQDMPVKIDTIRAPVAADMDILVNNLLDVVGNRHPMLMAAAQQIFGAGGKKLRPMLVLLVARLTMKHMEQRCGLTRLLFASSSCLSDRKPDVASLPCSDLTERHRRLAEITEMIHTASLVHDDVLDECDVRRGAVC